MNESIKNEIIKAVNDNGYILLDFKRYSKHEDDKHLFTVLAKKERQTYGTQYVIWLFNSSTEALNLGHYYDDEGSVYKDYAKREWHL